MKIFHGKVLSSPGDLSIKIDHFRITQILNCHPPGVVTAPVTNEAYELCGIQALDLNSGLLADWSFVHIVSGFVSAPQSQGSVAVHALGMYTRHPPTRPSELSFVPDTCMGIEGRVTLILPTSHRYYRRTAA